MGFLGKETKVGKGNNLGNMERNKDGEMEE